MKKQSLKVPIVFLFLWAVVSTSPVQATQSGQIIGWQDGVVCADHSGSGFVAVAAGGWPGHNFGLKADGSIVAWGSNSVGQCNVPSPNTDFVAVAADGFNNSIGLKADGSLVAWGGSSYVPSPNTGFVAVAASPSGGHILALKSDGSIVAWGYNDSGQCNVPSPNSGFVAMAGGYSFSLGLKADGSIVAWGSNSVGQCNIPSPNSGFVAVSAGYSFGIGLKADGSIVTWGLTPPAVPSPNSGFVAIMAGPDHWLGLKTDGSIVASGMNWAGECEVPSPNSDFVAMGAGWEQSIGLKADGSIVTWGASFSCEYNPSTYTDFVDVSAGIALRADGSVVTFGDELPSPNSGFVAVSGGSFCVALKADGSIVAWGDPDCESNCQVPSPNSDFVAISAGGVHNNMGLKSDGSIVVWGEGIYDVPSPNADFVAISAGYAFDLGLKADGSIVAWGDNWYGQCDVPQPNTGFVAISAGYSHCLGLKADGSVVAWGTPDTLPVPNSGFVAISAGEDHSLGLKADGSIVAWGPSSWFGATPPAGNGFIAVSARGVNLAIQAPPEQANGPTPANGATNIGVTADLSWIAGNGAASHDVYFGTVSPGTFQGNQTGTTFDTGTMANNTTYYWRIDEKNPVGTTTGEVWSFTTISSMPPVSIIGSWVTGTTHAKEAGTNRALVFIAHAEHTGSVALNSVKYGGRSMTKVAEKIISSGTTRTYVAAFILNNAGINAATSTTFSTTWSVTPSYGTSYESVFLQNVNQLTLTGATAANATSSGATITTSALANSIGDMVLDAATNSNTGTYTVNNGFTEALELSRTNFDGVAGYKSATGAGETPSVTHSTSNGRQSLIGFVVRGQDTTPPTPNPMTWATVPHATSATSISMTATTASDSSGVEYYFECISAGGHNSGWQAGATYQDTGLSPNTQYTYRVKARDKSVYQNETAWSTLQSVITPLPPVGVIGSWVTGTTHAKEAGTNRALVFIAHAEHIGDITMLDSVTYGGQPMTYVMDGFYYPGTTQTYVAAFILDEAGINAATSSTFSTSWSATPYYGTSYESVFLQNVDQSSLTGEATNVSSMGGATIATTPLANAFGDMIIDAATCSSTGSYTVNNGFTEALELSRTNFDGVAGYKSATGADETPSVRHSTSTSRQSLIGLVVNAKK